MPTLVRAQVPKPDFKASPEAGCSPLVVSFSDQSTGSPASWFWEFGNGATSTLQNPSTTYFAPGKYSVSLTVTNANGSNTIKRTEFITVYGTPNVAFRVSDSTGCHPFPVQFTDGATASAGTTNTSWVWDFGDGTQSDQQNPGNRYLNSGNYTVSLRVANDKGCWSVATKPAYIKIDGGVKADFTFAKPIACQAPFPIRFTNLSTGPGTLSYRWDFGDGDTATEASPVHTYANTGLYTVTLVTKSSDGCVDTMRRVNLLDLKNTTTSFTAPDSVCTGDTITFNNTSSGVALTTTWSFGDGTSSFAPSPVKIFSSPGEYTVKLVQGYGICLDSASKEITVFSRPKAGFTTSKAIFCQVPLTVDFQNNATGASTYLWNFGDGTTSTEANPTHTYTDYGIFDVTLTVTNEYGCSDVLKIPGSVQLKKPAITFTSLPVKGCIPYGLRFAATVESPEPVTTYLWDFGNGVTSAEVSPSYTYTEQGIYNVSLTVTTASGCTQTATLEEAVSVGRRPVVNFTAVPTAVCAYQPVTFTNNTNEGTEWTWNFGDGSTSSDKSPTYMYSDTGTFSVQLIANNMGCRDSLEIPDYVTVKPPIASFEYKTSCTNKLLHTFIDRSVGAEKWEWDFGDGTTSSQPSPTHTFPGVGTYNVQLTVWNDSCFHFSKTVIRIVNGTPGFTALKPEVCKGSPITFTADTTNAANIESYTWNFGNGSAGLTGSTATTTYSSAGNYSVSLTVRDVNGCVDSTVKTQFVQINGPTAALLASNNNGCKGLRASFTDASTSDGRSKIVHWQWNLGDGTTINQLASSTIQHFYQTGGSYNITLKVRDEVGCTDSLQLSSLVNVSDITADFSSADTVSCPGAAIRFANTSRALTPFKSVWSFGNGSTSTDQQPTMSYNQEGRYSVSLKITDDYGCTDSVAKTNYIFINRPVASFKVNDTASACIPFQVQYTNTSTFYTEHVWDLNGGTSRLGNPTQYYNNPGEYLTTLVVTSPGGCTDTATQKISVYDVGASRINYLPLSGCKPLTVDLSAFSPVKMDLIWDMGDGTIISSNETTKQHVYNYFGDFVPKLIMRNSNGCVVALTGLDTIRIKGATAKFGLDKTLFCDSGLVRFSDSTTFNNPITEYNWNFGDGTTSREAAPSHYYQQPGIYPVTLSVKTENRCVDTFRLNMPVKVVASPAIRIAGDTVICVGEGLRHAGLFERPDTALVRWAWRFPNGNTAATQLPERQYYNKDGKFVVRTTARNRNGCTDTAYQTIYVHPIPEVTLPTTITTMVGTPVLLPAIYSGNMRSYQWSVPDGLSCTTCPQPMAAPKADTRYSVQFVDSNGCRNRGEVQVIVLCNNENVFVPNTFSPNGDGSNDVFYVRGKGLSRVKSLRIFNRWGQVVFERANFNVNDASMGWDGTFKGVKPMPDVYVYQVEIYCDNSQVVKFDGNVALIQ